MKEFKETIFVRAGKDFEPLINKLLDLIKENPRDESIMAIFFVLALMEVNEGIAVAESYKACFAANNWEEKLKVSNIMSTGK